MSVICIVLVKLIRLPLASCGLGLRSLHEVRDTIRFKLPFKFIEGRSFWARSMRVRYGHPH